MKLNQVRLLRLLLVEESECSQKCVPGHVLMYVKRAILRWRQWPCTHVPRYLRNDVIQSQHLKDATGDSDRSRKQFDSKRSCTRSWRRETERQHGRLRWICFCQSNGIFACSIGNVTRSKYARNGANVIRTYFRNHISCCRFFLHILRFRFEH